MLSFFRCALVLGLAASPFVIALNAQQARKVTDGVYTTEQATRGQALYTAQCASCHGAMMQGAQAPPLTGASFLDIWSGPVSEVASKILHTMPEATPGTLT